MCIGRFIAESTYDFVLCGLVVSLYQGIVAGAGYLYRGDLLDAGSLHRRFVICGFVVHRQVGCLYAFFL